MWKSTKFLLTRPLRDVTQIPRFLTSSQMISTHTPLTGRDHGGVIVSDFLGISTHTPLTGRDHGCQDTSNWSVPFLLTRPLRDVTCQQEKIISVALISTHTPLTGRDMLELSKRRWKKISTHTPLTGRDLLLL